MIHNIKITSNPFVSTLTRELNAKGSDVEKIAQTAIENLKNARGQGRLLNSHLYLWKILDLNICTDMQIELIKLITQVYFGGYCKIDERERLDTIIANVLSYKPLPNIIETIEVTSKLLVTQKNDVQASLLERILQEEKLGIATQTLLNQLPPKTSIQEVVDVYDVFARYSLEDLFLKTALLIPDLDVLTLHHIAHLFGLSTARNTLLIQFVKWGLNKLKKKNDFLLRQIPGAINEIPKDQRKDVIAKASPFMINISCNIDKQFLLRAISEIPKDQREDVIAKTMPLLTKGTSAFNSAEILKEISYIPSDEREDVIAKTTPLLSTISDGNQVAIFLKAISEIPKDKRRRFLTHIAPLWKGVNDGYLKGSILQALNKISADRLEAVIEMAPPLIEGLSDQYTKPAILQAISEIPEDQLDDVIAKTQLLMKGITDGYQRVSVLREITLTPPEYRENAVYYLSQNPKNATILFSYLSEDDDLFLERTNDYLLNQLESAGKNQDTAYAFSKLVIDSANTLLIDELNATFLMAVEINTVTDPDALSDPKNPYTLFHHLINQGENPLPCNPPKNCGLKVNIDKLREIGNAKTLTYDDLPKINKNLLKTVFDRVKIRTNVKEELNQIEMTLKELEMHLFGEASIVPRLLKAHPNSPVGYTHQHLFTIIKALSNKAPREQEEMLIGFGCSIRECKTGQVDALAIYYNLLASKYRTRTGKIKELEYIESLIDASVQSQLNVIFSDESLFEKLIPNKPIGQLSHQTTYLKNRLCKQLGLKHHITFDPNTGMLLDELLTFSTQELLDAVIEECRPEVFIEWLKREMNKILEEDQTKLQGILNYIQKTFSEISYNELFEASSEDTDHYLITREGAKLLLRSRGYLKKIKKKKRKFKFTPL